MSGDDSQPRGYYVGECGHRVPIGPDRRVSECRVCDPSRPTVPDVCLPTSELYTIKNALGGHRVVVWCRLCDHDATAASAPAADRAAVEHLAACHRAVVVVPTSISDDPA